NWHFGQTKRFSSRSLRNVIARQFSHLVQRPSVRMRRSSGGVDSSIPFFSCLNQAMKFSGLRAFSSLYHAARECFSCTGVSLLSSRSQGPQVPPASDARFFPCKSRELAPGDPSTLPQFFPDRAFCS